MLKSESYNATICNIVYTELKYSSKRVYSLI